MGAAAQATVYAPELDTQARNQYKGGVLSAEPAGLECMRGDGNLTDIYSHYDCTYFEKTITSKNASNQTDL